MISVPQDSMDCLKLKQTRLVVEHISTLLALRCFQAAHYTAEWSQGRARTGLAIQALFSTSRNALAQTGRNSRLSLYFAVSILNSTWWSTAGIAGANKLTLVVHAARWGW